MRNTFYFGQISISHHLHTPQALDFSPGTRLSTPGDALFDPRRRDFELMNDIINDMINDITNDIIIDIINDMIKEIIM